MERYERECNKKERGCKMPSYYAHRIVAYMEPIAPAGHNELIIWLAFDETPARYILSAWMSIVSAQEV